MTKIEASALTVMVVSAAIVFFSLVVTSDKATSKRDRDFWELIGGIAGVIFLIGGVAYLIDFIWDHVG